MSIITTAFYALWLTLVSVYTLAIIKLLSAPIQASRETRLQHYPTVSLVIPTYNEARVITQKLENVLQIEYPRESLEILVIDSGSTDSTRETVKRFAEANIARGNVTLIEQPIRRGKSAAINQALQSSDSELFALTDADVMTEPQALSKLISRLLGDEKIGAASGVEVPFGERGVLFDIEWGYKTIYTATRLSEAALDAPFMCESEFSVFKRKFITPLKPGCMCDDLELTIGVRRHGVRALYASDVPFFENEATVFKPKLRHKYRRGMANQHGILRHWRVMFNKAFGRYGSIIFPFEFFLHIISPILIATAIILFGADVFVSPGNTGVEALTAALSGLLPFSLLWKLTRKYKSREIVKAQGRFSWVLGAISFTAFQTVLVASLVHLAVRGPKLQWTQISETRPPINKEIRVAPAHTALSNNERI